MSNKVMVGGVSGGLGYGFSASEEKEFLAEGSVGFDFNKLIFYAEGKSNGEIEDAQNPKNMKSKEVVEKGVLIYTHTAEDGETKKHNVGVNPEVGIGLVGVGLGVNVILEPDMKLENNSNLDE